MLSLNILIKLNIRDCSKKESIYKTFEDSLDLDRYLHADMRKGSSLFYIAESEQEAIDKVNNDERVLDKIEEKYVWGSISERRRRSDVMNITITKVSPYPVKNITLNILKSCLPARDFLGYCRQELFPIERVVE